ncbi:SPW repeat protein [Leisingera sp. McT4-56]|uniref:SPW repeat protein n=1 Tax=Leisingera sp. McT4-56 TaxID=2881255 RepID=UPI001CF91E60|nr:SPW repeat protein [Leisingera sp. McT4-56]MCB4457883.1 SPW repeat protein [Leisingera sp. McT4-56]
MQRIHWQDGVTLLTGFALAIALFFLNVTPADGGSLTPATWNFVLVGIAAAALAATALLNFNIWEEWIEIVLGAWLIISPWVLGYSSVAILTWMAVIGGAVIVAMGATVVYADWPMKRR